MSEDNSASMSGSNIAASQPTLSDAGSEDFHVISVSTTGANGSKAQPEQSGRSGFDVNENNPSSAKVCQNEQKIVGDRLSQWVTIALDAQQQSGTSFTEVIRDNRNFHNPAIFEKMITYCGIDEFGTHLPKAVLGHDEYYEAIAALQETKMKEAE